MKRKQQGYQNSTSCPQFTWISRKHKGGIPNLPNPEDIFPLVPDDDFLLSKTYSAEDWRRK